MVAKTTRTTGRAGKRAGTGRRRKRAIAVAGLVLASVVFAAVLGEIVVRARYGPKFRPRAVFGVGDTHLGWKPSGNLDDTFYGPDYSIHIRTDRDGYRLGKLGEVEYTKNLVVLLGDSYAFGWGLSTDDTFASQLDALLARESGGALRLVNLGVGGYGVLQSADRLEQFLRSHPQVRVRTVIQQHCVNDAVDNLRSLGYHLGVWEIEAVERPRSRSHLLNLIAYARMVKAGNQTAATAQASNPEAGDLQWSFQRKGAKVGMPRHAVVGGVSVDIDPSTYADDLQVDGPDGSSSLSPVQRGLMAGSLNVLHAMCVQRGITVVHTFIAGTPAWYVDEVAALADASAAASGCRAVVTGMLPSTDGSTRSFRNEHSGGHFNAEFSRFWAQRMAQVLYEKGAVTK